VKPLLALAFLLPAPLCAEVVPPSAVTFVQAVQANGCAMSDAEAEEQLPPLGLSVPDVHRALEMVFAGGGAAVDAPDRFTLSPEWCAGDAAALLAAVVRDGAQLEPWAPEFTPEEGVAVVSALRANACTMTEAEAETQFPPLGLSPVVVRDVSAILLQGGLAEFQPGTGLMLEAGFCAADPADDGATIAQALAAFMEARQ
jgi:hypothetical protein